MRTILFFACLLILAPVSAFSQMPPIHSFAEGRVINLVSISPNGKRLAFVRLTDGNPILIVNEIGGGMISAANLSDVKPTALRWAGNDFLLIRASKTERDHRLRAGLQRNEYIRTFSFDIKNKKLTQMLLRSSRKLSSVSFDLGTVIGVDHKEPAAFMTAFNKEYELNVYKVETKLGRGHIVRRGKGAPGVQRWILNSKNEPAVRVIHNQKHEEFRVQIREDKEWKDIYKTESELGPLVASGLNMDETALVVQYSNDARPFQTLYEMDLETGKVGKPFFKVDGYDVEGAIRDPYTNLVIGATWTADQDEYHWFDPQIDRIYKDLRASLVGYAVRLTSWSRDRKKFIIAIAKPGEPVQFAIHDAKARTIKLIAAARPALKSVQLGPVKSYSFKARDGLTIHSYLTTPPNTKAKNLPLVVLPHGGPEARDDANFDWISQMLASRGYAVLQPNFRGSDGYGWDFTAAGWGEWGKAMQDDVTDGVKDLIAKGVADPNRICIVGASYGGYAALAGGAFTPDLYKCVIAISAVSDLKQMYDWTRAAYGTDHWAVKYWDRSMTGEDDKNNAMRSASPIHFAGQFKAPVLLIHGEDDTVVRPVQSRRMKNALKRAGKDVRLIEQKNGDHWMSFQETRIDTAEEVLAFLETHLK